MTKELAQKHQLWWNRDTSQELWIGSSFSTPDDRQELSDNLSKLLASRLMKEFPDSFAEFVKTASVTDAGESALWNPCRPSLSQCVADLFGNQD